VLEQVIAILDIVTSADKDLRIAVRRAYDAISKAADDDSISSRRRELDSRQEKTRRRLIEAARLYADGNLN
jgi:hypothetical protein